MKRTGCKTHQEFNKCRHLNVEKAPHTNKQQLVSSVHASVERRRRRVASPPPGEQNEQTTTLRRAVLNLFAVTRRSPIDLLSWGT